MAIQYKTVDLRETLVSDVETQLSQIGKDGWDLIEILNNVGYFKAYAGGSIESGSLSTTVDAFGRSRVALPYTLGDYKHIYAGDDLYWVDSGSGGYVSSSKDRSSVFLHTSASVDSYVINQTKMYHNYLPGKSQLILGSFIMGEFVSGSTKRIGYFDEHDGIFFEQDATGSLSWVVRSSTSGTGSIQEVRIPQENWNVSSLLDGAFVLDTTKTNLMWIDFQWLAVGRIRVGFVYKGAFVLCHAFDHTNIFDVAYMKMPNLPVRAEIINTLPVTSSMEVICASVQSEGGYTEAGFAFASSNQSLRSLSSGSTLPVFAIKLKNNYEGQPTRAFVRIEDVSLFTDQQTIRYEIVKLPSSGSLTNGTWQSINSSSLVEVCVDATAVASNGSSLFSGFVGANSTNPNQASPVTATQGGVNNKVNFISQNIDSTSSEVYVLIAKNMTASTTNVAGSVRWKEVY
jgi:hypothetical protein